MTKSHVNDTRTAQTYTRAVKHGKVATKAIYRRFSVHSQLAHTPCTRNSRSSLGKRVPITALCVHLIFMWPINCFAHSNAANKKPLHECELIRKIWRAEATIKTTSVLTREATAERGDRTKQKQQRQQQQPQRRRP